MFGRIVSWVIGLALTALYASTVVAAIGNITQLPGMAEAMGLGISGIGWFWLVVGVTLPVVVFLIALFVTRKRTAGPRLLALAAGIGVVAAVQLEIAIIVPKSIFFA